MAKNTTNEFIVLYRNDFKDPNSVLKVSCKNWNNVAKNQLKKKINTLEDIWENEKRRTRNFEVNFQNGSTAYCLYIPKDISVYELHEEIRESWQEGIKEADVISFNVLSLNEEHQKVLVSALTSMVHLIQWKYPTYGKKAKKKKREKKNFGFYSSLNEKKLSDVMGSGEAIAEGTNLARTLATTPTNYMTAKDLVEEARKVSKRLYGSSFKFINENKLKEMKAGCFLSVIQGTKGSDGGIVHMSYRTRAKDPYNIAIVGKGVVFDTGGYDVKTDGYMNGMHRDMTGSAVALSLYQALVKQKVKANIDLYLAVGENLISEAAYKPNDVVVAMDGTSVEVKNTDAEGRMLMVDTILYAKDHHPELLIDFATLTGDCVSAIDERYSAVLSNDYDLGLRAVEAGMKSGERVWNFPLSKDFSDCLESEVADIMQCQDGENAEHIYAAAFLKHFVGDKIPWIHVDLASEKHEGGLGLVDTEITGFGVRWGYQFITDWLRSDDE